MNPQTLSNYQEIIVSTATEVGLKILAAIAFWVVGRWLIGKVVGLIQAGMNR
ncbi:MAG: mechanosensitive ion channel family protein, partial [Rhodocyclaceae bacterium]|nr:mechanosensitive ion channel family protein [Rhodocyclaceae bacterium]